MLPWRVAVLLAGSWSGLMTSIQARAWALTIIRILITGAVITGQTLNDPVSYQSFLGVAAGAQGKHR